MAEQVRILKTKWVPIDSVKAHPDNPRRSNEDRIRQSLQAHAQYAPIVVHEPTGQIIVHNHVWHIAKELGHKRIYATFVDCSEEKAKAVLAVDNRSSDDSYYDDQALLTLLESLGADDLLAEAGYEETDLELLLRKTEAMAVFDPEFGAEDMEDEFRELSNESEINWKFPYHKRVRVYVKDEQALKELGVTLGLPDDYSWGEAVHHEIGWPIGWTPSRGDSE